MRTKQEIFQDMDENEFITRCVFDKKFFIERVFGYYVKPFHEEWLELIESNRHVCFVAPRGHGKTEILGVCLPIWNMLFNSGSRNMIVAATDESGIEVISRIRDCILNNELLKQMIPEKVDDGSWSKHEIKVKNGSKTFSVPFTDKKIRGKHVDYVLADEVETYANKDVFNSALLPTLNMRKGHIVAIGTPLTDTDLLADLQEPTNEFICKKYQIIMNGEPIFPEKYPMDFIKESLEPNPNFRREYMCELTLLSGEALFPDEYTNSCIDYELSFKDPESGRVSMGCDFALSQGRHGDYSVFTVVEELDDKIYIRHMRRIHGMGIEEQKKIIREMFYYFKPINIYLDESGFGQSFLQDLRNEQLPVVGCDFHYQKRNKYLVDLKRVIEEKRLVIPLNNENIMTKNTMDVLRAELSGFMIEKAEKTGVQIFKSTTSHDDTVMSLALSVIPFAQKQPKYDNIIVGL